MGLLLAIVLAILIFGGGPYWFNRAYPNTIPYGNNGIFGLVIVVVVIVFLLYGRPYHGFW